MLRAHYRSPLNYSDAHLDDARSALRRLYTALDGVDLADARELDWTSRTPRASAPRWTTTSTRPSAIAVLFDLAAEVNRTRSPRWRRS